MVTAYLLQPLSNDGDAPPQVVHLYRQTDRQTDIKECSEYTTPCDVQNSPITLNSIALAYDRATQNMHKFAMLRPPRWTGREKSSLSRSPTALLPVSAG